MKIEKVGGNKIKVDVTSDDLINLNLNIDNLTPDSPELHAFLFQVMERVKKETGFNPYSGQIVVEATPSGGGITLMVTKIGKEAVKLQKNKTYKKVRAVKKESVPMDRVYAFEQFDDLCYVFSTAPASIFEQGFLYEYRKVHYLVLQKVDEKTHALFSEFCADSKFPQNYRYFLEEHAKKIAEGESLLSLVSGVKDL